MFTGIIEEVGEVSCVERAYPVTRLTVTAPLMCSDCGIGDSIAVDGACLTVISHDASAFTVEMQEETVARTIAGGYRAGSRVNCERAVTPVTRLGGHYVQGHIDTTGHVRVWRRDGADWVLRVAPRDHGIMAYVVEKGFIAVNGISLTVTSCGEDIATHIIPHTREVTTLSVMRVGDEVNLEVDVLAKYIEKLCAPRTRG